jgi:hypothetical protein
MPAIWRIRRWGLMGRRPLAQENTPCPRHPGTLRTLQSIGYAAGLRWRCPTCKEESNARRTGNAKYIRRGREWRLENPAHLLLHNSRNSAKARGFPHTLSADDIAIPSRCPVLGIPIRAVGESARSPYLPSLDRLDNTLGYTPDNVRIVSWAANRLRGDLSLAEFEDFLAALRTALETSH